jgi:uncharacterized protein (DUF362 family)
MHIKTSRKSGTRVLSSHALTDEYVQKELTRRQMVQAVMLGTAGALFGGFGSAACTTKTIVQGQGNNTPPAPGADGGGVQPTGGGSHLVGMGWHESDRDAALDAALKETIGLGMIKAGQSVYLRVNSNSGDPYPYSTSPKMIERIGGMLQEMGVTDIRIGDRSFWGDTDTTGNLSRNGITGAAKKLGLKAVAYDDDAVEWVEIPAGSAPNWVGTVRLPEPVTSADHHIILSCVKTHFIAQVTMSLKISLGLVHAQDRAREGNLKNHDTSKLHKQVAQINKAITPSLVIMDGYQAIISGGPTKSDTPPNAPSTFKGGVVGDPKVFIVTTDRIAADVCGIAVLQKFAPDYELVHKTKPFANPHIKASIDAGGLGISSAADLDLSGPTVPEIDEYKAKLGIA